MENCDRPEPPLAGTEQRMLAAFLDWQRATLLCKAAGVADDDLRRPVVSSSSLTLLGLVKHLADVERGWFRRMFAGETLSASEVRPLDDPDRFFRIEPDETTEEILASYRQEVERSRQIIGAASLDDVAVGTNPREPRQGFTLRWILLHMIEETARHNGHADLLREAIDGQTGE